MYFSRFNALILRSFALIRSDIRLALGGGILAMCGIGIYELNVGFIFVISALYEKSVQSWIYVLIFVFGAILGGLTLHWVISSTYKRETKHQIGRILLVSSKVKAILVFMLYQCLLYAILAICFLPTLLEASGRAPLYPQYSPVAASIATAGILGIVVLQVFFFLTIHSIVLEKRPIIDAIKRAGDLLGKEFQFWIAAWIIITLGTVFFYTILLFLLHLIFLHSGSTFAYICGALTGIFYFFFFSIKTIYWTEAWLSVHSYYHSHKAEDLQS